jgi:hypothetical protein
MDVRRSAIRAGVIGALAAGGAAIVKVPGIARLGVGVVIAVAALALVVQLVERDESDDERNRVLHWTLTCFGLHVLIGTCIVSSTALVLYLGPDALGYHAWAAERARAWTLGAASTPIARLGPGKSGFTQLLAGFYWITTPSMVAGIIMNGAFAAGLVPLLHRATTMLFGRDRSRSVPALVTLLPPFLVWPSQLLREAPVLFLLGTILLAAVSLQRRVSLTAVLTMIIATALLLDLRGTLAYPLVLVVVLSIVVARRNVVIGALNAASVVTLLVITIGVLGIGFSGYQYASDRDLTDLSKFRQNTSREANSGFDDETETETTSHAITYLFGAAPRFLAGPAPWQATSARQVPAILDAAVWWWALLVAWRGFRHARDLGSRRPLLTLLLPAAGITVMLSLGLGNYGLVVRQRPQVLLFLVPLIALGLTSRRARAEGAPLRPSATVSGGS